MKNLWAYKKLLRVHLWPRSAFPFLIAVGIAAPTYYALPLAAMGCFFLMLLWGGLYALNDCYDAKLDAKHWYKKNRPIPSGKISQKEGYAFSLSVVIIALLAAYIILGCRFFGVLLLTTFFQLIYTFPPIRLKNRFIFDLTPQIVNPTLRFAAGWVMFTHMSNLLFAWPVLAFMTFGFFSTFLYEKTSPKRKENEKEFKFMNTVSRISRPKLIILAKLTFILAAIFFLYSTLIGPLNFWYIPTGILSVIIFTPYYYKHRKDIVYLKSKNDIVVLHLTLSLCSLLWLITGLLS